MTTNLETSTQCSYYDVLIIGGGVVGCAVLRAATLAGWKCALIELESDLLSHASGSNSGIACTGVDATPGTLERALIRDSNAMFRIYCKEHKIPIRPCGSLVCSWPWDVDDDENNHSVNIDEDKKEDNPTNKDKEQIQGDNLNKVYDESYDANDTHVRRLSSTQIKTMEPNLSPSVRGGVHIPGEIVVDPWLYSISLAIHARENGADIFTNCEFNAKKSKFDCKNEIWNIVIDHFDPSINVKNEINVHAKAIVNAAGLWSDTIQEQCLMKSNSCTTYGKKWNAKPRRGQYRIYSCNEKTTITHPIQPIPTQRTKGIFVFSSIYNQIVVGPTALDQESKTDRSIDPIVGNKLDDHVKRIIPFVDTEKDFIGEYVGIRPGTDKRDYQIHVFPKKNWVAVAGIRSTGLTASLGIGNYVMRNLNMILDDEKSTLLSIVTTPLPSLDSLIEDFQSRNDGYVEIHGFEYKVTHPLTKLGWSAKI